MSRLDWQEGSREEDRIKAQDHYSHQHEQRQRYMPDLATGPVVKPPKTKALTPEQLATARIPPFVLRETVPCDECADAGFDQESDPGGLKPCKFCHGRKTVTVERKWLTEAFAIAANSNRNLRVERGHVVALAAYSRLTVAALMESSDGD